jgi:ADP-heptose:LPS heptosyltransferase
MFTFYGEIHVRVFSNDQSSLARMGPMRNDRTGSGEDGETALACQVTQPPDLADRTDLPPLRNILVIRLSALGDFIMALPAMAAIRRHHPASHITLLTTKPLAKLAERSGWFDKIEIDSRPAWHDLGGWIRLRRRLRAGGFQRVYDLQSQDRTALYFRLFWPWKRPEWSGIAPGASHPHTDPGRKHMHAYDIHAAQLKVAGIADIGAPNLDWLDDAGIAAFDLPERFALLVPGSAPHRPAKRWPAAHYGALARWLAGRGVTAIVIGTEAEKNLAVEIGAICPQTIDLTGRTSLFTIATLARRAVAAIGNDTGPMHLIAMIGCPVISLFSSESDPKRSAPRGRSVVVMQRDDLSALSVEEVAAALAL